MIYGIKTIVKYVLGIDVAESVASAQHSVM